MGKRMSADDRKQAIIMAALPLFARKGFAETTTKDLAKAAGVSEPLLYKHFPSKEALYAEIQNVSCTGTDLAYQKLAALKPCASTLVYLVYYLMRAQITGKPAGKIDWDTRHRLMIKSFLEDGSYARVLYKSRFDCFCSVMESCLVAAEKAGEVVAGPVSRMNRVCFTHHVGAWVALAQLPANPPIDYKVSRPELLRQSVHFVLRGMGLTDKALATYYNPEALELFFGEDS